MSEYRLTYTLYRDDQEIGFGSSMTWEDPADCGADVARDMQNSGWETERGMPEPEQITREIQAALLKEAKSP